MRVACHLSLALPSDKGREQKSSLRLLAYGAGGGLSRRRREQIAKRIRRVLGIVIFLDFADLAAANYHEEMVDIMVVFAIDQVAVAFRFYRDAVVFGRHPLYRE